MNTDAIESPDLLPEQTWRSPKELQKLVEALAKANPDSKWTRKVERMGLDQDNNPLPDTPTWMRYEEYRMGGVTVFSVKHTPGTRTFEDHRSGEAKLILRQYGKSFIVPFM